MWQGIGVALITALAAKRIKRPVQIWARLQHLSSVHERRKAQLLVHMTVGEWSQGHPPPPLLPLHNTACIGWGFPQSFKILP